MTVPMLDLSAQYRRLQSEIDAAVQDVCLNATFINGPAVKSFCERLKVYMDSPYVIPCGNATDALRMALQALKIGQGDEVILPAFAYIAPAEAIVAVGATPVVVDVDPQTFNINPALIENAVTTRAKAIIPVHLFGQACDMTPILKIADKYNLAVVEDNAQSLSAMYELDDKGLQRIGTIGQIGVASFFPTKPLGCYGDGGAMFTADSRIAEQLRLLATHGQTQKYYHAKIGCNSRLDTIQAAILNVKLNHIGENIDRRREIAARYDGELCAFADKIATPVKHPRSTHVYHQYTLRIKNGRRDALKALLAANGIQTMIYYPMPIHKQEAYRTIVRVPEHLDVAERLCNEALSLPIDPEMTDEALSFVIQTIVEIVRA